MLPTLKPGDRVIASSIPYVFSNPKPGDAIIFRYNNKALVKRIVRAEDKKYYVRGDNQVDSLRIEFIRKEQILGKVIYVLMY